MKSKGWDAKLDNSKITVNIQDLFTSEISVEKTIWHYEFQVRDFENTKKTGETEDPIAEFRRYYQDPEIQEAYDEAKEEYAEKEEQEKHQMTKKPGRVSPYSDTEFSYSLDI